MRRKVRVFAQRGPANHRFTGLPSPHFSISKLESDPSPSQLVVDEKSGNTAPLGVLLAELQSQRAESAALLRDVQENLTPQEIKVLIAFVQRPHIKFVASRLGSSEQTIRNQLATMRKKLRIASTIELVSRIIIALFHLGSALAPLSSAPTHLESQP